MFKAGSSIAQSHWPEQSLAWFSQCKKAEPLKQKKEEVKPVDPGSQGDDPGEDPSTTHDVYAFFEDDPEYLYDQGERENGENLGVLDVSDMFYEQGVVITGWNMYSFEDFFSGGEPKTVDVDAEISAEDPEFIVLTPIYEELNSKHVNLWLNKNMYNFGKDVLIGEFDVWEGGYQCISKTPLPDADALEGFDVLYYGDNPNLVSKAGVTLEAWVNEAESEDGQVGFFPDDFVDYDELPEGDEIDLYGLWYDPVVYGVTYHANRSSSDDYVIEMGQFSDDGTTLTIDEIDESDEGMQNAGYSFKGWNTAADGSGEWVTAGEKVELAQLGLGDRAEYVQDLEQLANLQVQETPIYDDAEGTGTETDTPAGEFESLLESKYTAHLYAQWRKLPTWKRLTGKTRYDTMASIVSEGFESSRYAVLATGENFPDALAGAALMARNGSALLLVKDQSSPTVAHLAAKKLDVESGYFLGGTKAIPVDLADYIAEATK